MYYRIERPEDHGQLDILNVVLEDQTLSLKRGAYADVEFDFSTARGERQKTDLERQGYKVVEITEKKKAAAEKKAAREAAAEEAQEVQEAGGAVATRTKGAE